MARLVLVAEVVHRLDDADAEEVRPQAIDGGASEERIVRRGHPVGQRVAGAGLVAPQRLLAVEKAGLGDALGAGDGQFAAVGDLAQRRVNAVLALRSDAAEESGLAPELLARPFAERVIVALGAFQADAEEQPGRARRQVLRLALLGLVKRQRRRLAAAGVVVHVALIHLHRHGDEIAHHAIVGDVVGELLAQPALDVGAEETLLEIGVGFGQQQIAPNVAEVGDVARTVEQPFDGALALVGGEIAEEAPRLGHQGDASDRVQRQAAQVRTVLGSRRRRHLFKRQTRRDELIDLGGENTGVSLGGAGRCPPERDRPRPAPPGSRRQVRRSRIEDESCRLPPRMNHKSVAPGFSRDAQRSATPALRCASRLNYLSFRAIVLAAGTFHNIAAPSVLAVANVRPSGEKATEIAKSRCAWP